MYFETGSHYVAQAQTLNPTVCWVCRHAPQCPTVRFPIEPWGPLQHSALRNGKQVAPKESEEEQPEGRRSTKMLYSHDAG
jgi:hypothetical protein